MSETEHKFSIPAQPDASVFYHEYGVRLDKECKDAVWDQIQRSRGLYNDIIASIKRMFAEMNAFVMDRADAEAHALQQAINDGIEAFKEHKTNRNEEGMKAEAQGLREKRAALGAKLKEVREKHKREIQERFLSRVGRNASCETYQLRKKAVDEGLGFATATAVLDRALKAFSDRFKKGMPPEFAKGADKLSDSLTIQFTLAGGCPVETLFNGEHSGVSLRATNGYGPRKYGEFMFRLGAASASIFATGSIQFHRPLPDGAHAATASLVRMRIGKDYKYKIQLLLKVPQKDGGAKPFPKRYATIHFGWAATETGRHVMAIADQADPGAARLVSLPESIEQDLAQAEKQNSDRDLLLNTVVEKIKGFDPEKGCIHDGAVLEELAALKRLPANKVSQTRLYRLCGAFVKGGVSSPAWLEEWRREDRLLHQSISHTRSRALNRRRKFYEGIAHGLAANYQAIVLERLDLKRANTKVDTLSGEISKMSRKSRHGQRLAANSESILAIRNAAGKTGTVIIELAGEKTVQRCAICGEGGCVPGSGDNAQTLSCPHCGAEENRKQNGAAIAWQLADPLIDDLVSEALAKRALDAQEHGAAAAAKKEKMAAGRAASRALRELQAAGET